MMKLKKQRTDSGLVWCYMKIDCIKSIGSFRLSFSAGQNDDRRTQDHHNEHELITPTHRNVRETRIFIVGNSQ